MPQSSGGAIDNYRTILNTNTGQYAVVDSQKEVVTSYDKSGNVIWTTNVIMALQKVMVAKAVRGLKISGIGRLESWQVTVGNTNIVTRGVWFECGKDSQVSAMLNIETGDLCASTGPITAMVLGVTNTFKGSDMRGR